MTGKYWNLYNESHWADPEQCDIYERSNFFVEKSAWNFIDYYKNKIKLTVFLPGLVIGTID